MPDITDNLDTLSSTTKALAHVCAIQDLSQHATALANQAKEMEAITEERKTVLEDAAKKWDEHEKEIGELAATIAQAKAAMFAPELETKGLRHQMKAQEVSPGGFGWK